MTPRASSQFSNTIPAMTLLQRETHRLSRSLLMSGWATLGLAVLALALPEATLVGGMLIVGLLSVLFGISHVLTSMSVRDRTRTWTALLCHGLLAVVFGLLTVGATALTFPAALVSVSAWLVARSLLAVWISRSIPVKRSVRRLLTASAIVDGTIAILVVAVQPITIFQYLFFGAVYAAVYGVSQIVAGVVVNGAPLDHSLEASSTRLRLVSSVRHSPTTRH